MIRLALAGAALLLLFFIFLEVRSQGTAPVESAPADVARVATDSDVPAPPVPYQTNPSTQSTSSTTDGCFAPVRDYNSSVPSSIVVPAGHQFVAGFFRPGESELVTVLTAGTWRNDAGYTFGVTFDYPACPQERVISEAMRHANRRGGSYLGVNQGLSRT